MEHDTVLQSVLADGVLSRLHERYVRSTAYFTDRAVFKYYHGAIHQWVCVCRIRVVCVCDCLFGTSISLQTKCWRALEVDP